MDAQTQIELEAAAFRRLQQHLMPMDEWKANHQTDASSTQQSDFKQAFAQNVTDKS